MNKFYSQKAIIPLFPNEDIELTCFICMNNHCEYFIEAKGCYGNNSKVWDGKKLWIGIHEECARMSWEIKDKGDP